MARWDRFCSIREVSRDRRNAYREGPDRRSGRDRARYELTPGNQVEFVDEGGTSRLLVRRRVTPSDPAAGYGLVKVKPAPRGGRSRRLSEFDPASLLAGKRDRT